MARILQLLLTTVAVGLSVAYDVPPYGLYVEELKTAAKSLTVNLISMEDHIPLLNDSRRHYAEIAHVINVQAIHMSYCGREDYHESYYRNLNQSAPEALYSPEVVIHLTRNLLNEIHDKTKKVIDLINQCTGPDCDLMLYCYITSNEEYSKEAEVLISAGQAAIQFNAKEAVFEAVSRNLRALQYVIKEPGDIETVTYAVAYLHQKLHPNWVC